MSLSKKWLPEVEEPMGLPTSFCAFEEGSEEPSVLVTFSPALDHPGLEDKPGVWVRVGGDHRRWFVTDEALAYALSGARKARANADRV